MMKRKSISKRVQRMLLGFTLVALVISSLIAMMGMRIIRDRVTEDSEWLGYSASSVAAHALTEQMEQNRKNVADSRAEYAGAQLNRISGYVESLSSSLEYLYKHKSHYNPVSVLPPNKENGGKYVLMRDLRDESVKLEDVKEEMELLGNIEPMCESVVAVGKDEIATMYLGTESGVLISYDPTSQLSDPGPGNESYYDYTASNWYGPAKEKDGIIFTDTYLDNYGRGLNITCAMPFRNEKGEIAGVVGIDILVSDLLDSIIDLESNDGSYVILVDKEGDVIASPYMDKNSEDLSNIRKDTSQPIFEVADQILDGKNGITRTAANIYYSYSEIGLTEWTLVICIPAESISEPVQQISDIIEEGTTATTGSIGRTIRISILLLMIVLVVITAAVTILSGVYTRRIIHPLISLRDDVMRISGGDLSHRAEIVENDEIGDLATSFNNMSASLTEYIDNLTKVTAEKERIGAELNVATQIQADMLPRIFPPFPEKTEQFDIYATMNPAKEVGGDFYDFFLLDDNHIA
ncbi:MAG: HAMP domain-containing protein, partial [Lachnospiraceae bacterium]|nr:HAMP domain-containing protein [Lachnospiraceae bacterium]